MEDSNLSEKLRALARGKKRSATARIREKFDDIEAALKASVPRIDVHQALIEDGITITFESFELAIYRIRKKRNEQKESIEKQPTLPPVFPTGGAAGTNPLRALSGKPSDGIPEVKFEPDNKERK